MEEKQNIQSMMEILGFLRDNAVTQDQFNELRSQMVTQDQFNELRSQMVTQDQFNEKISELKNEMVTKIQFNEKISELKNEMVTKIQFNEKISELKNEIITHADDFVGLHKKSDLELTATQSKIDRIEAETKRILTHLDLDPVHI